MATTPHITPLRITEPPVHFSHSIISRAFTRLNASIALYIECERDLEHANCFDPAFHHWTADAERARARVLNLAEVITTASVARREDLPLKRSAMLTRALVECSNETTFTSLHRLLGSHAHLFACCQPGAIALRAQQMLETHQAHIDALAELGEFNDLAEGWTTGPSDDVRAPLTAACAF